VIRRVRAGSETAKIWSPKVSGAFVGLGRAQLCFVVPTATDALWQVIEPLPIFSTYRSHNAGVEGSSPSLSTNQISHFRLPLRSHDREPGTFAGLQFANLLRGFNQRPDFRRRIVRSDVIRFVAQEELAILEAHADGSKPVSVRVFEILDPDGPKSSGARSSKLVRIALRGATACRLPSRIVDPRDRSTRPREHKFGVLSATAFNHRLRDPVQDHIVVQPVLHKGARNHED
jgi:hypothetical protein